jgi:soluble P-type ATPase
MNVLKEIQIETYVKLRSTDKKQNVKSKNKETYIKTEIEKYINNEINRLEFIKNVCYKFLPQ